MKKAILALIIFSSLLYISCQEDANNLLSGKVIKFSSCKGSSNLLKGMNTNAESCIYFSYDGNGLLKLKHVNAGFNCCPQQVYISVKQMGNKIIIDEKEMAQNCRCLCLYDVEAEIINLAPGKYTIAINEPYAQQGPPLEFDANLIGVVSDSVCVGRNYYPWGI